MLVESNRAYAAGEGLVAQYYVRRLAMPLNESSSRAGWSEALRVYWAFWWPASLGSVAVVAVAGFAGGALEAPILSASLGFAGILAVSVACVRRALRKRYRSFGLAVHPNGGGSAAGAV